jgi:hypothetical protein
VIELYALGVEPTPRTWVRRLAPLAVLVVPLLVVAAFLGVDAVRPARSFSGGPGSGALPGVTTPSPTPTPTPTGCPESGLSVRPGGQEAAMGLRVLQIVVVNCGTVPRTVRGHPVLRLLDEDRRPLDAVASPGSSGISGVASFDAAPATVTLQPGQQAMSAVLWRNLVTDPSVRATLGMYLEVTVTAGDPPQVIEPEGGIDLGNTVKLGVAPWSARP